MMIQDFSASSKSSGVSGVPSRRSFNTLAMSSVAGGQNKNFVRSHVRMQHANTAWTKGAPITLSDWKSSGTSKKPQSSMTIPFIANKSGQLGYTASITTKGKYPANNRGDDTSLGRLANCQINYIQIIGMDEVKESVTDDTNTAPKLVSPLQNAKNKN